MAPTACGPVIQVLMNDDLLRIIFQFCNSHSEGSSADLANYARVCRAFYRPAVGLLWTELSSITPLWHLLAPPTHHSYHEHTEYTRIEEYLCFVSLFGVLNSFNTKSCV